jgi:hypothetical protein
MLQLEFLFSGCHRQNSLIAIISSRMRFTIMILHAVSEDEDEDQEEEFSLERCMQLVTPAIEEPMMIYPMFELK